LSSQIAIRAPAGDIICLKHVRAS